MLVIVRRPHGYKAGLLVLLLAFLLYVIGFTSVYWTVFSATFSTSYTGMNLSEPFFEIPVSGHNGLWKTCDDVLGWKASFCASLSRENGYPGWVVGVQVLECGALIGLIVACGYAVAVNLVLRSPNINNRHLEIITIVSGVLGFLGTVVYAAENIGKDDILLTHDDFMLRSMGGSKLTVQRNDLAWGFCLSLSGCLLALVSAVVVCAYNRLTPLEPRQEIVASPPLSVTLSTDHSAA